MGEKPIIRYIFFDLDNLLYPSSEIVERQEFAVAAALKDAAPKNSRLRAASIDEIARIYSEARKVLGSNAQHFPYIFRHFGIEETPELISAGVMAYQRTKIGLIQPYPHVIETILSLREKVNCGVITDGYVSKQWDKIHLLSLHHLVSPVIISEAVAKKHGMDIKQVQKPYKIIYDEAIETVNFTKNPKTPLKHSEAMYVDDRLTGVLGARLVEMSTILIPRGKYRNENPEQLANEFGVSKDMVKADFTLGDISKLEAAILANFRIERL